MGTHGVLEGVNGCEGISQRSERDDIAKVFYKRGSIHVVSMQKKRGCSEFKDRWHVDNGKLSATGNQQGQTCWFENSAAAEQALITLNSL